MNLIGLDFGERRIGVAASDPLGLTAQPMTVIERASLDEDLAKIEAIVTRRRAEKIVLGLPLNMDGTAGPQAKRVRRFAATLHRALGVEIILWDERLTTVEAEEAISAGAEAVGRGHRTPPRGGRRHRAGRQRTDAVAAAVILRDYLEAQRRSAEQ